MQYKELVEVYKGIEKTSKRLEKTFLISELLKKTPEENLKQIILLLQGRIFPSWDERKIGVAARLVIKAINIATGIDSEKVEEEWKKTGDLGLTAESLIAKKKQFTLFSKQLEVAKVFNNLRSLPQIEGEGAVDKKIKLIAELLTSASPLEAKYIVRNVLEDLRVGVGEGSIRDAIVWAYFGDTLKIKYNKEENDLELNDEERETYNKYVEIIQEACDLTNDFSKVAEIAKKHGIKGLENVTLEVGNPIKVMLYPKAKDIEDAFETVGKPAILQYKYDGFRMSMHRNKDKITLFTRRLENVTAQFPDVVELIKNNINSDNYILDAEVIGIDPKTRKWLPFQNISQRIKRKYDINQMVKEIPIMINIFDAIQLDGKTILKLPYKERIALITKATKEIPEKIQLARQIITDDKKEAEAFYKESLNKGNEGIMIKNLEGPYKPGARVGYGVKVKPVMETLDLVIVAAEWGEGKRASFLSSFTVACIDDEGNFLEIGRVGTGIKEKEESEGVTFEQLTNLLKPLVIAEIGREVKVKPVIVIELRFEEIQKSPTYSSGYALRFPRLVRIREDRSPDEISTLSEIEEHYDSQKMSYAN
jgi:DNA ligase-1